MLTRKQIEERLPKTLGRLAYEGTATRECQALETAQQLAEWLERCCGWNMEGCQNEYGCAAHAFLRGSDVDS